LAGQILWAGKAEKGEVASPLMTTYGENSKMARLSFFFHAYSDLFTPNEMSSYWGSIGWLEELILMLENLRK
jgi:hypothetical protein